jgi:hypothetical protein
MANVGASAASTDIVVISHINIKNKLTLLSREQLGLNGIVILRAASENSSNINFVRLAFLNRSDQFAFILE